MNTPTKSLTAPTSGPVLKTQLLIGGLLLALMIVTRGNLLSHMADASWAIFFMVGFYLRGEALKKLAFPLFFLAAFVIDLIVIDAQGGQHYCFTPSYPFLIPAYAAMWFAGRLFASKYQENARGLATFVASATVGVAVCFFISNAGFYAFSGKFEEMTVAQYASSVAQYLPGYLKTTSIYLGFAALVHLVITHSPAGNKEQAHS